jgi:chromosome partitioning protein
MAQLAKDFCLSVQDLAQILQQPIDDLRKEIIKLNLSSKHSQYLDPDSVRKILQAQGFEYKSKVVSFQMLKGGVAKTTSALNFGWRAAMYGARVLFIDLDQQANLTYALMSAQKIETESLPVWVDVVEKKSKINDVIINLAPGLDLIPSSLNNSVLDRVLLSAQRNWSQSVKVPLAEIRSNYDLVIIDTAPNLSLLNTAVTCASDEIILPINPDKFSILGVDKHLADLAELKSEFGLHFKSRVLLTRFDGREALSHEILTKSIEKYSKNLMKHYVRTSTDIKNLVGGPKNIFSFKSNAKEDYDLVTREIMDWL